MNYTITAYSTALFSTWINVEELNLLIDAGDGITAGLLQKSRKIKNVFITHPDRDHLNGLPQFMQLNARDGMPKIHYPKDSGSFPAMQDFLQKFDPHVTSSPWIGIEAQSKTLIKNNIFVEAIRNEHIQCPANVHKSLSYKVYETKSKLKSEFLSMPKNEIIAIVKKHGNSFISETIEKNIISFSGDTPVDDYSKWDGSEILIHEATFLMNEDGSRIASKGNKHSHIDEVLKMVKEISVGKLILNHFSSRYSIEEINHMVRKLVREYKIQIPVYLIYPGEVKRNILQSTPINE